MGTAGHATALDSGPLADDTAPITSADSEEDRVPAYVIYQADITDEEQYARYRAVAPATITAAGGRFLARGGETTGLEGEVPAGRTVIVEFPDRQAALDWYHGERYADARALREHAATGRMYVVDGID